ncbi:DNA-directed RNA polymerase subunit H [Candidatus Woesearchaeota archaeon]|nr:DNA-directed RNA polymerase subunit H [Candidatus Woesearchaeota archaeon]
MKEKFDIKTHNLVPKHTKLNKTESKALYETYQVTSKGLPKIFKSDPAIADLKPEEGDIIMIERSSPTAGVSKYYRVVTDV